jgi:hypothetical protein
MSEKGKDLVLVEWVDSFGGSGWKQSDDAHDMKPARTVSVGWLIVDEPARKVVAPHLGYGGSTDNGYTQTCGSIAIPTVCITSMVKLSDRGKAVRLGKRTR